MVKLTEQLIKERLRIISIYLNNSDQHINHYRQLEKKDPDNKNWYSWEIEQEKNYKENLKYQVETIRELRNELNKGVQSP